MSDKPTYTPQSGDYCRLLGDGLVEHHRCDDWRDGTVTDCTTGKRIKAAPHDAIRGFKR